MRMEGKSVWESEAQFYAARDRRKLWEALRRKIDEAMYCPPHLSVDDICQIAALLKIKLPS